MLKAKVMQLFRLFSGLEHAAEYADLTDAAVMQVTAALRDGADPDDLRLCYYAAACANLQYRRMRAAAQRSQTFAGTTAGDRADTAQCDLAERLAAAYRDAAAPLLRDDAFVFIPTEGECR